MGKVKKTTLAYFGLACLLYISFNVSLSTIMFPGTVKYVLIVLSVISVFIYSNGASLRLNIKNNHTIYFMWFLLLVLMLFRNYDLKNNNIEQVLFYTVMMLLMLMLDERVSWFEAMWKVVRFFCIIHLMAGIFFLFNKSLLINNIVPFFHITDSGYALLMNSISAGYITGLTSHYSTAGMYMAIGTISFAGVLFSKKKTHFKQWIPFLLMFLGIAMTGKRGPLIFTTLAIAIVYVFVNELHKKNQFLKMLRIIVACICLMIASYVAIPQVRNIVSRFTVSTQDLNTLTTGRVELMWVNAVSMFQQNPILGAGWRAFRYNLTFMNSRLNANDAHNIYLQLLAETGIVGFVIVLSFFVVAWKSAYNAIKKQKITKVLNEGQEQGLKLALIYQTFFLLYGITGNPLFDRQCYIPYFICCIMGISARHYVRRNSNTKEERI